MSASHRIDTSVLIIGSGGSGLRAAIELAERAVDVLVLSKRSRSDAHTALAAGGINAALGTMDPQMQISILDSVYVTRLLVKDNVVFGAYGFDLQDGSRYIVHADAVILAAGGHTRIWRRTSSRRDENTGDAWRLALDAGGRIRDPELVQFHPSGLLEPEDAAGTLVSEAARGEGGILRNALGERFMARYDPDRMELSTRDRVALACYTEIKEGRGTPDGGVLLDVSHLPRDVIMRRLLVFGRIVGEAAATYTAGIRTRQHSSTAEAEAGAEVDQILGRVRREQARPLQRALRNLMTEHAGVVRDEAGLRLGLTQLDEIEACSADVGVHPDLARFQELAHAFDLRSSMVAARATLEAALERRETRGCHNRSDYPALDPSFQINLVWSGPGRLARETIAPIPGDIAALMLEVSPAGKYVE